MPNMLVTSSAFYLDGSLVVARALMKSLTLIERILELVGYESGY
jgi:hypothetical protein